MRGLAHRANRPVGCCGRAFNLWQSRVSRPHSDIEISCFGADLPFSPILGDVEIAIARNKRLTTCKRGTSLPPPPFSLWLRRHGGTLWDFEISTEAQLDAQWVYRRETSAIRSPATVFTRTASGWPIIGVEIQLLCKCKPPRDKDRLDLSRCVPALDDAARLRLRSAVAAANLEFLPRLLDIEALGARNDGAPQAHNDGTPQ